MDVRSKVLEPGPAGLHRDTHLMRMGGYLIHRRGRRMRRGSSSGC